MHLTLLFRHLIITFHLWSVSYDSCLQLWVMSATHQTVQCYITCTNNTFKLPRNTSLTKIMICSIAHIHFNMLPSLAVCCVNTAWLRSTYKPTANRCQHAPAVVFDPSVPVFWLFHAPEQTTAIVVLPCIDLVCGTVFLMN